MGCATRCCRHPCWRPSPPGPTTRPPAALTDFKAELHKLNKSLLFLYVELLRVLVEAPSARATATTSIIHALQNMMHLTNLLRPYQAS